MPTNLSGYLENIRPAPTLTVEKRAAYAACLHRVPPKRNNPTRLHMPGCTVIRTGGPSTVRNSYEKRACLILFWGAIP